MKKKLWCVLCIMICMMMIAACGQKKNPEKKKSEKAEQEETEFKDRESLKLQCIIRRHGTTIKRI